MYFSFPLSLSFSCISLLLLFSSLCFFLLVLGRCFSFLHLVSCLSFLFTTSLVYFGVSCVLRCLVFLSAVRIDVGVVGVGVGVDIDIGSVGCLFALALSNLSLIPRDEDGSHRKC